MSARRRTPRTSPGRIPPERRVFCNRTLNLRSIRAIGYDLDYTLLHYKVEEWERTSFSHLQRKLAARNWPVEQVAFDPQAYQLGLIIDRQLGNIVKANQFGYIKRGLHGTRPLDFERLREVYAETIVDMPDPRFVLLNTLFSHSEANMYAQLVDLLDERKLGGTLGYNELYGEMKAALDETHMEGQLKAEIAAAPERFVDLDPETPQALLDQRQAGHKLVLVTNSDWTHTHRMLSYAFDRFLPQGMTWRELFDIVLVSARKPAFFTQEQPAFQIVDEAGMLQPLARRPAPPALLLGGHAGLVEAMLGLRGSQILYVGDHAYADVHISKKLRRWRTALVIREIEEEIRAQDDFRTQQVELERHMARKERLERRMARQRLALQRRRHRRPPLRQPRTRASESALEATRRELHALDNELAPLAIASGQLFSRRWGLLMRSGNDKSYLARMVERHADIYTSRVSNLVQATPYAYFRARRGPMPHDELVG